MRTTFLVLMLALALPAAVLAQPGPDLVVTLRDGAGAGVAGAVVQVRDRSGARLLAQAGTDAQGVATLAEVPLDEVRVAVVGRLATGQPLVHVGEDAAGVRLVLAFGPTALHLVVEADGRVIPDPALMVRPDPGAPPLDTIADAADPPAAAAPSVVAPTDPIVPPAALPLLQAPEPQPLGEPPPRRPDGLVLGLLGLAITLFIALVVVLIREQRARR